MDKWNKTLNDFLNNKKLLQDIKTILITVLAIGMPLIYFFFFKDFNIFALLDWTVGWLLMFVVFGNVITWFEIGSKALRDEIEYNKELQDQIKRTNDKRANLPSVDDVLRFNEIYNDTKQHNRNVLLTDRRKKQLQRLIDRYKILGKKTTRYEQELARLDKELLEDKSYKPINPQHVINQTDDSETPIDGNDAIHFNPVTNGFWRFLALQPFKGIGFGGLGTALVLAATNDPLTILIFYIIYIISLAILVVSRYLMTRKKTQTRYLQTQKNIETYIDDCIAWYNKENKNEIEEL